MKKFLCITLLLTHSSFFMELCAQNVISPYLDLQGPLYARENINTLNKAGNGWIPWAVRNTSLSETKINLSNIMSLHVSGVGSSINATSSISGDIVLQSNTGSRSTTSGAQLEFVIPADADGGNMWGQGRIITVAGNTSSGNATGKMIIGTRRYFDKGPGINWNYGDDLTIDGAGNIGINNLQPSEKLHVSGNIRIGKPEAYTEGTYYINMPDGSGTINGGNGRDLVVTAGSSDNQSAARGGLLILRPGTPTAPSNNYGNVVIADNGGNLGVGTQTPAWKLDVNGPISSRGQAILDATATEVNVGDLSSGDGLLDKLNFYTRDIKRMTLDENGNFAIGTTDPKGYKLAVNGKTITEEVVVKLYGNWPDYVFSPNYKLPSLSELEQYIKTNKHLPEVPTAEQVKENGLSLGEMNAILLKKVEELTLFLIEQNKRVSNLEKENLELKDLVKNKLK